MLKTNLPSRRWSGSRLPLDLSVPELGTAASLSGEYQPVIIAGKIYRCFAIRDQSKPDPVNDELVLVDEAGKIVPH